MSVESSLRLQSAAEISDESHLYSRVTWRLIPFLFACYVAAYLDRVNVGFAKLEMLNDLNFSQTVYGLGAGIFFLGYFLFEVPSNIFLHRVGAKWWISRIMITWSLISGAMMFVTTPTMFYVMRFLLGAAEAGLFPGVMLYLTYWYPAKRRGKVIGTFMASMAVAGIIGGPLSGWIMHGMAGVQGLKGWQWMFLLEALPSLALGIAVLFFLDNRIDDANWLTAEEKALLKRNVAEDGNATQAHSLRDGFLSARVWLLCAIYFGVVMGVYGVGFWLPTLIKNSGVIDPLTIGFLSVLPYAAAVMAMVLSGHHSDRVGERRWHVVVPALISAFAWVLLINVGGSTTLAILVLSVATMGIMTAMSQFWCMPTALLSGAAAASGIAVVNSVGNLAGFISPYMVGWIIDRTSSTEIGFYVLAGSLLMGGLLALLIPKHLVNR